MMWSIRLLHAIGILYLGIPSFASLDETWIVINGTNETCILNSNLTSINCTCIGINDTCCDPCSTLECFSNSSCVVSENCTASCQCENGTCFNVCDTVSCANGHCNTTDLTNFTCICDYGYFTVNDSYCQSYCDPDPCLNAGGCAALNDSYQCNCTEGFMGHHCGQDIDECELGVKPEKCPAGSLYKCVNMFGSYRCICPDGYLETTKGCQIAQNSYQISITFPNLTFSEDLSHPTSTLFQTYATNISESLVSLVVPLINDKSVNLTGAQVLSFTAGSVVAQSIIMTVGDQVNGSIVHKLLNSHTSSCYPDCFGINGTEATISDVQTLATCDMNHCPSWTTCIQSHPNENLYFWCKCKDGFSVVATETQHGGIEEICQDINECETNSKICGEKSGKCVNTIGSYKCVCQVGYEFNGTKCVDSLVCTPNPCKHDGICSIKDYGFQCDCSWTRRGSLCEDGLPLILLIIACILALIAVLLLLGLIYCWKMNQKSTHSKQYRPESWLYLDQKNSNEMTEFDHGGNNSYSPERVRNRAENKDNDDAVRPISGQFSINNDRQMLRPGTQSTFGNGNRIHKTDDGVVNDSFDLEF